MLIYLILNESLFDDSWRRTIFLVEQKDDIVGAYFRLGRSGHNISHGTTNDTVR